MPNRYAPCLLHTKVSTPLRRVHGCSPARSHHRYFAGFYATSRFWRLHVLRNYGALQTRLTGVRFYGLDLSLAKWFAEQRLTQYLAAFIADGCKKPIRSALRIVPRVCVRSHT